jgi:hypothetical protein
VEKALPEPEEAEHRQGSMKTHRKIIPIVALALLLPAFAPASAPASSILSGYGGPGQGTQAILGSTLLNGPSGGGGPQGGVSSAALAAAGQPRPVGAVGSGGGSVLPTHAGKGASRSARQTSGSHARATERPAPRLAVTRASTGGSGVLGLSNTAFLVILLALGALVFTGLLTRGLAKPSGTRWHAGS